MFLIVLRSLDLGYPWVPKISIFLRHFVGEIDSGEVKLCVVSAAEDSGDAAAGSPPKVTSVSSWWQGVGIPH